ncbi:DUF4282 domain-containing protein [Microbacterium sp. 4R-513]|uniref:DUF4282 domain-containing protein n=1 Tax=Microbacterium sp. 4R-513 TaxID=2567934 RepID=UPI0013E18893|nr:DUF4282 domain-containing protein [Microbacterium sp. 4R-513]QIG38192.1 DUF4282 domain-containing protein [Microbacterium sp. 4R-513]
MSNTTPPPPPPLPEQPASQAAADAAGSRQAASSPGPAASDTYPTGAGPAAESTTRNYNPAADPDDTGVPPAVGDASDVGRGFIRALFDISFRTFITRRLASAFYVVGLVAIGIGFLVYFIGGIVRSIGIMPYNTGAGVSLLVATLIIVPIVTFLAIVVLRFIIEAVVALIAIAENTQQTADNTER